MPFEWRLFVRHIKIAHIMSDDIDLLCINTIRTLSIDAVQKANSGHPGTPMALAPVMYTLWQRHLRYDPADSLWPNRDRFVLSAGHASMMLYSTLFLAGVREVDHKGQLTGKPAVSLDDIKAFRQLDSKCPGHPEYGRTTGVEATTGPLGQGCGMSVGMAIAALWKAKHFNRPDLPLFDYRVFAICSDGDIMEGVSSEAASIAGHLRLPNLCWIYDNNHITIEGNTNIAFDEDVEARYKAYGWNVIQLPDANDTVAVDRALSATEATKDRPTLIMVRSHIGYGAPHKQDTKEAHGEALGVEEVRGAKRNYGWPEDATFLVPNGVPQHFADGVGKRGHDLREKWDALAGKYRTAEPALAASLDLMHDHKLPAGWDAQIETFAPDEKGIATRDSGGKVLNEIAGNIPWLMGGAADLTPSTKTDIKGAGDFEPNQYDGRNFHFGIREHAMGAIVNGMTLSDLRGYGSTFLVFSDYMKGAIRLSALMDIPSLWIFTHDSIGLGEDGPTHQPIEQLIGLRAIPGLMVLRPCDANEVAESWRIMAELTNRPAALVLSRQKLPTLDRTKYASAKDVQKGAYVLSEASGGAPQVILIATGSEVQLCLKTQDALAKEGLRARVVSIPSWELFDAQDEAYRDSVLPPDLIARVSVEASASLGWERYTGLMGARIGMHSFGASAPAEDVFKKFGITADVVAQAARDQIARQNAQKKAP
jgi:transketolase